MTFKRERKNTLMEQSSYPEIKSKVVDTTQTEIEARARNLARLAGDEIHVERFIGTATSQVIEQKFGKKI